MRRSLLGRSVAAVCVLGFAAVGAEALAGPRVGPPLGTLTYAASLDPHDGVPDSDDFVIDLVAGETLQVTLAAAKGSTLLPDLSLVDPDGVVLTAPTLPAVQKSKGKKVYLKSFTALKAGRWAVRVSGRDGTQGGYTLKTVVRPGRPVVFSKQVLDDASGLTDVHEFTGVAGATLEALVTWKSGQGPVRFTKLAAPGGAEVQGADGPAVEDATAKGKTGLLLQDVVLPHPAGTFSIGVGIESGRADYTLKVTVRPPKRLVSKKAIVLPAGEPTVAGAALRRAIPGRQITVTGAGFSTATPPTVRIGETPATDVTVAPTGDSLVATVPDTGATGLHSLSVQNPDGQGGAFDDAVFIVPLPTITDLTTPAGAEVRGGGTSGGQSVRLHGTNFEAGYAVRFGGSFAAATLFGTDGKAFDVVTPAGSAGLVNVTVADDFGRVATSAFQYLYKAPPVFGSPAYSPAFGAVAGGTVVTVTGSAFETDDVLAIDGATVTFTRLSGTAIRFTSPAKAAGTYSVTLTDRLGTVVAGPGFPVKGAPTITSTAVTAGPHLGTVDVPFSGGQTVQVTGADFEAGDTVRLGSTTVTATNRSGSTKFDFTVPISTSAGDATLTVTDALGQTASLAGAVRYVGFLDASATRAPAPDATDDLGGVRAVVADIDGDEAVDDVAIVSSVSHGTRGALTRLLFGDGTTLADQTAANIPPGSTWDGVAITIGDLDGDHQPDIVTTGAPGYTYTAGYYRYYYGYYGTYKYYVPPRSSWSNETDVLTNGGSGDFSYAYGYKYYNPYSGQYQYYGYRFDYGDPSPYHVAVEGHTQVYTGYYVEGFSYYYYYRYYYEDGGYGYRSYLKYVDGYYTGYYDTKYPPVFDDLIPAGGMPNATDIAIGDIDSDGDLDLVTCADNVRAGNQYMSLSYLGERYYGYSYYYDYTYQTRQYSLNDGWYYYATTTKTYYGYYQNYYYTVPVPYYVYRPSLRILDNVSYTDSYTNYYTGTTYYYGSTELEDVSFLRLPKSGTPTSTEPAYPGRALQLADIDGDEDLDIVVTWDDPTTTTPIGLASGTGVDDARICTRVLLNDGAGKYTDATDTWMPAVSSPEFWQGHRLVLTDLDGDEDPDLVLVVETSTDAFLGKPTFTSSALRVLRNDGAESGFTDVTGDVLPSVPLAGTKDDNLRGKALLVDDVNGDSYPDIVVGTTEALVNSTGGAVPRTRLLLADPDGAFSFLDATAFLPAATTDSGESDDLKLVDVASRSDRSLLLLAEKKPSKSAGARLLRVFDWYR